ncbi:MAG: hypothetical protein JRH12_27630, partial [Deltaproteobacteria bacterium]|nr:hypothetical protein [Deltaproteobacteria bacterium]
MRHEYRLLCFLMSPTPGSIENNISPSSCDLCGLSLSHGQISGTFSGKAYHFCCNGCRQVFNILLEASDGSDPRTFKHSDLFKQCREKGIIPKSEAELAQHQAVVESESSPGRGPAEIGARQATDRHSENELELFLKLSNMWCPACAWVIDETLKKSTGVIDANCNF